MSTLKEIPPSKILQRVMFFLKKARKEILATMDLTEEIKNPLPLEYFFLLQKKIEKGTKVIRLVFGTEKEFKIFNKKHKIKSKNYNCVFKRGKNYKRMLLIDSKYLFFATGNRGKRFFYTTNPKYIKNFSIYFHNNFK